MKLSIFPEVLALSSCWLFYGDRHIVGSVFLVLSLIFGLSRMGMEAQANRASDEKFNRILNSLGEMGTFIGAVLGNILMSATQTHVPEDEDKDDIEFN